LGVGVLAGITGATLDKDGVARPRRAHAPGGRQGRDASSETAAKVRNGAILGNTEK